ncbi:MAG: hypothetical protein EOO81_05730, partial [Oxalobacteraceae bacterium]
MPEPNGAPQIVPERATPPYTTPYDPTAPVASNDTASYYDVAVEPTVVTQWETATAVTPTCDMATHTLYEYYNANIGGYYYPTSHDTVAEGQQYRLTGETMTVFSNNCSIRPRAKISDCFYSTGMLGYHYLSTDDNCNLGGSPNATAFGWTERTIGPEYSVVVH